MSVPRTLLVLTYRFPPQGGSGARRTLKTVKHLRRHGWRAVVHTVRNPWWPLRDEPSVHEIPSDVTVYRTPTVEMESLEVTGTRFLGWSIPAHAQRSPPTAHGTRRGQRGMHATAGRVRRGFLAAARHRLWSHVLVPDAQIAWVPGALVRSLWIARRERVAALYSTSPPNSINVLGLALCRLTGLPWIADLRDPWTDGVRRRQWYRGNPVRQAREERWERSIFAHADHVLVTADPLREILLRKYPWYAPERLSVVTNGFDPDDFPRTPPATAPEGVLRITSTGTVESMFDAIPLLVAVNELLREDPGLMELLRLDFFGAKRQARYDAFVTEHGLETVVRFHGYVPHSEAVRHLQDSHALLLCVIPRHEYAGTKLMGKMFDYLYLRKPILALTTPGMTTRVLDRAGLGLIAGPDDVPAIKEILRRLIVQFQSRAPLSTLGLRPDDTYIDTFDLRGHMQRLAAILDDVVDAAPEAPTRGTSRRR